MAQPVREQSAFTIGFNGAIGVGCGCLLLIAAPWIVGGLMLGIVTPIRDAAREASQQEAEQEAEPAYELHALPEEPPAAARRAAPAPAPPQPEHRSIHEARDALGDAIDATAPPQSTPPRLTPPAPRPSPLREWTDASGRFAVEAEFQGMAFGKVKLKKADGVIVEVPYDSLSITDQEWIRRRR